MASNPGWVYGYVPTAAEWNAEWASKADDAVSCAQVATIAALRANTTIVTPIFVRGYIANRDGGEGMFVYVSTDVTSADNGGTIIVDASGRRWYRETEGRTASVRWFGARGDGATDDAYAFNQAITACTNVIVPYTAAGYWLASPVTVTSNQSVIGENFVKLHATGAAAFLVTCYQYDATIQNFLIDMTGAGSGSSGILFRTSLGVVWRFRARHLHFMHCYCAMQDEDANYCVDFQIEDVWCRYTLGRQIYIRHSRGFILLRSVQVDHTFNGAHATWEGARFEDVAGLELERFDVVGPSLGAGAANQSNYGLVIIGAPGMVSSVWLTRILVDTTEGSGIFLQYVSNLTIQSMMAFGNLGSAGIFFSQCQDIYGEDIVAVGTWGQTGSAVTQDGITFSDCIRVTIANIKAVNNNDSGVVLRDGCQFCNFTNPITFLNGNNGWAEVNGSGTTDFNIKSMLVSTTNGNNSLVQQGAGSACVNWTPNNGAFTAATVGTAIV